MEKKRVGLLVLGLAVIAVLIYSLGPARIWHYASKANPYFLLVAAAVEVLGGFLYSLAWYITFKPAGVNASLREAYLITLRSIFLLYTAPSGIVAEVYRINAAKKHAADDYGGPTASVLVHRVLYGVGFLTVAGFATFIVYSALSDSPILKTVLTAILATLALVVVAIAASFRSEDIKGAVRWAVVRLSPLIRKVSKSPIDQFGKIDSAFDTFASAMKRITKSPVRVLASYAVISIRWILVSVVAVLVMYSIGFHGLSIWEVMIVMMIAEIVSSTPVSIPGMVGILDAVVIYSYVALGAPSVVAAAVDILTRVVVYGVNIPLTGSVFYISSEPAKRASATGFHVKVVRKEPGYGMSKPKSESAA